MSSAVAVVERERSSLSLGGLVVLAFGALDFGARVLDRLAGAAGDRAGSRSLADRRLVAGEGFPLASVVAIPLFARLGDIFGRRRLLLGALGAFCVGSLMCAVAGPIGLLIAGRIVQGAGAAIGPLAVGLARDALPPERLTWRSGRSSAQLGRASRSGTC